MHFASAEHLDLQNFCLTQFLFFYSLYSLPLAWGKSPPLDWFNVAGRVGLAGTRRESECM